MKLAAATPLSIRTGGPLGSRTNACDSTEGGLMGICKSAALSHSRHYEVVIKTRSHQGDQNIYALELPHPDRLDFRSLFGGGTGYWFGAAGSGVYPGDFWVRRPA